MNQVAHDLTVHTGITYRARYAEHAPKDPRRQLEIMHLNDAVYKQMRREVEKAAYETRKQRAEGVIPRFYSAVQSLVSRYQK